MNQATENALCFASIAAYVSEKLLKSGVRDAELSASNFERNLGWDKTKLMEEARRLASAAQ